jgi:hypothetical protein
MTAVVVKPCGASLLADPPQVDLSTASISETLSKYVHEGDTPRTLGQMQIEGIKLLSLMLPADSFSPFRIDFGTATDDEVFPLIMGMNRLNEMIGGNGIEIETIEDKLR